mmetsp:Transcript_14275/g.20850  ORF Transcript_14275/g.20850 Transcript_14275/m.20850 type:complete len:230 (-) Transcript_14275:159-848(-)
MHSIRLRSRRGTLGCCSPACPCPRFHARKAPHQSEPVQIYRKYACRYRHRKRDCTASSKRTTRLHSRRGNQCLCCSVRIACHHRSGHKFLRHVTRIVRSRTCGGTIHQDHKSHCKSPTLSTRLHSQQGRRLCCTTAGSYHRRRVGKSDRHAQQLGTRRMSSVAGQRRRSSCRSPNFPKNHHSPQDMGPGGTPWCQCHRVQQGIPHHLMQPEYRRRKNECKRHHHKWCCT